MHKENYKNFTKPAEQVYPGKLVRIRGIISAYQGKPQIAHVFIRIVGPQVMVANQTSSVSFQAAVQVRNKLLAAYQDVMNMQI